MQAGGGGGNPEEEETAEVELELGKEACASWLAAQGEAADRSCVCLWGMLGGGQAQDGNVGRKGEGSLRESRYLHAP